MSYVGLDPISAPLASRSLDSAALDLEERARRIAELLREAGQALEVPSTLRDVASALRDDAADLGRRAREVLDDGRGLVDEVLAFLAGDVASLWNGGPARSMPWGRWLAGANRVVGGSRYVYGGLTGVTVNRLPLFNTGLVGRPLTRLPAMGWLGGAGATAALRGLGAAGGLYTGVSGTVGLVRQGNPVDAYRREGAGYVADMAGTAFGYSSAAFLVAPNPVTGAAMVGTGVVWLGAEAWDHREEIVDVWNGATGWAGDRLADAGGIVSDVGSGAARTVGDLADAASFWD